MALTVTDHYSCATVVLFGQPLEFLFGLPATQLHRYTYLKCYISLISLYYSECGHFAPGKASGLYREVIVEGFSRLASRIHREVSSTAFVLYCHALRKTATLQSKRRQFEELLNFGLELKKLRDV